MGGWGWDDAPTDPGRVLAAANLATLYARIEHDARPGAATRITASLVCAYHELAMTGILDPGQLRTRDVVVGSRFGAIVFHEPPAAIEVPTLLDAACAEIERLLASDPVRAAAYALWRLNWIHPFADGNGRTARAIAYLVIGLGFHGLLPGTPTLPEAIASRRYDYQDALEAADRHWRTLVVDVSAMEALIYELLAKQLASPVDDAG